jgi:hypothetical protein
LKIKFKQKLEEMKQLAKEEKKSRKYQKVDIHSVSIVATMTPIVSGCEDLITKR